MTEMNCPLCNRTMDATNSNEHHLIPKCKKGTDTVRIHKICHQKIHATFTESELNAYYHTIERILENEEMQKFVKWVAKRPVDFYSSNKDTSRRKSKRRR